MRKKKVKAMKRMYAALFFLTTLALFSCNKDDFDPNDYENNIIGEWKLVHKYHWEHTQGREPTENDRDVNGIELVLTYVYKEGGVFYYKLNTTLQEETWKIVGDRIVINDDYETAEKIIYLTPTELKTEVHFMDTNGNRPQEVYDLNTYERQ